jgi:hypothetical protein
MVVRRRATLKIHAFRIDMRSSIFWTNQQCGTVGVSWSKLCQLFCRYDFRDDNIVWGDLLAFQKKKVLDWLRLRLRSTPKEVHCRSDNGDRDGNPSSYESRAREGSDTRG